jgi:hypothetical protein
MQNLKRHRQIAVRRKGNSIKEVLFQDENTSNKDIRDLLMMRHASDQV